MVDEINKLTESLKNKSDQELKDRSQELRAELIEDSSKAKEFASKEFSDKSEQAKKEIKAFDNQFVRAQTGIGADGPVEH